MADRLLQGFIRKFMLASTPFDPDPRPPFNDRQDGRFESGGKAGTGRGSALIWWRRCCGTAVRRGSGAPT